MVAVADRDRMMPRWAMQLGDVAAHRMRADPTLHPDTPEEFQARVRRATHVHIQNVADYLWIDSEREVWDPRHHVAGARCPWSSAWFTFRRPAVTNRLGKLIRISETARNYCGILHEEEEVEGRVLARSEIFMTIRPDGLTGSFWETSTVLDRSGSIVECSENDRPAIYFHRPAYERLRKQCGDEYAHEWATAPLLFRTVALLACAFANCRNVEAAERTYVPRNRKARRRGDYAGRRYYILGIHPVAATPHGARPDSAGDRAGVSYHICRGHFADYRKGRGLFGRYHGRFWVPQHARGRRSAGEVEKDYAVLGRGAAGTEGVPS